MNKYTITKKLITQYEYRSGPKLKKNCFLVGVSVCAYEY